MMENFKEYQFKGIRGKTDLKSENPYFGEWSTFSSYYNVTEEEYLNNPKSYQERIKKDNENYTNKLKEEGEFGKEYTIKLQMPLNPAFDNITSLKEYNLINYKMIII